MESLLGLIIGIAISAVVSGLIIWIVSKLGMGLHVDNFGWAMLAGLLIGLATNLIMQVVPAGNDIVHIVVNLVVSAAVIFACGSLLKGMTVDGYGGALIAAVAIAVVGFLLALLVIGGATVVGGATNP
jgi:putative membrane protein